MPNAKVGYSTAARREFIDSRRSRFSELEYSYRDIAREVGRHWARKPPAANTIMNDLKFLDTKNDVSVNKADAELLAPDNFRQWRAHFFTAPNGKPYLTTEYHMALFHIIAALALKTEVPSWVLEFWGLDDSVNNDIEARNVLFTVILLVAPRHGKSDLVQHAIIWLICTNPNIRIIYCQGILTTSQEAMDWIKLELENNDNLIAAYGPFKDDKVRWNATGFTVATRDMSLRSPTLRPVGVSSNIRSQDADIIIVDDPQDIRRATSEPTLNSDFSWFTAELMTRREPHTPVFGVGSHLPSPYGDLWSQMEDSKEHLETDGQKIFFSKLPAHRDEDCEGNPHETCVVWPELRPYGFLMAQRALLGEQMYDAVYQQNPRPDGLRVFEKEVLTEQYIPPYERDQAGAFAVPPLPEGQDNYGVLDHTRSWKNDEMVCCGPLVYAGGFDPAAGESKGASESAFMYKAACTRCRRRFYIDWWAKQQSPERNPDTILSFARSYPKLQSVRIEINAYQKSLARDPRLKKGARELRFGIEEWRTDDRKNDPSLGVPNLARFMRDGVVSIPAATAGDIDFAKRLTAYYIRYPRTPNDIVMADWLCDSELDKLIDIKMNAISDRAPGWEDMPQYLREMGTGMEIDLGDVGWE